MLNNDIITVVSFKLPKPDITTIESETNVSEIDKAAKLIDLANIFEKILLSKEEFKSGKKLIGKDGLLSLIIKQFTEVAF